MAPERALDAQSPIGSLTYDEKNSCRPLQQHTYQSVCSVLLEIIVAPALQRRDTQLSAMRFALFTLLQPEFAASSWVQDASTPDFGRQEQQLSWASASGRFRTWAQAARPTLPAPGKVDVTTTQSFPACPHKDLLCLAQHMQQPLGTANNSSLAAEDHVPIAKAVSESLLQLAASFETQLRATAAAAVRLRQQQCPYQDYTTETCHVTMGAAPLTSSKTLDSPIDSPQSHEATVASADTHAAHVDRQHAAPDVLAAASGAAAHEEELKVMLFWMCHLTMTLHQFILQLCPAHAGPPGRTKKSGSLPLNHHQQQQQKWLQKTLPAILQQLCCCYRAVAGQPPSDLADCSLQWHSPSTGADVPVFSRRKDITAADQLLLSTCFSILSTATPGSSKSSTKPTSSNRSSNAAAELPLPCLQLCAAMFGSHVLLTHQQQMQQDSKQRESRLVGEFCRILQDSQHHAPQHKSVLVSALTGLVADAATMQQGMQVLCSIAEAVFTATQTAVKHKEVAINSRKKRQQPQHQEQSTLAGLEATARVAADDPNAVLLLELIAAVLQQTANNRTDHCCQQTRLLAAAMLPALLPAAVMYSSPHARKLWLTIAGTAAMAAITEPIGVAVSDSASSSPISSAAGQAAAAAVHAHITGVAVLAAAASSDKDANVRNKALSLLQEAVPIVWQHLVYWQQREDNQQRQHDQGDMTAADSAVEMDGSCPITATLAQVQSSFGAMISTLESQLLNGSKSCRIRALQLMQELLCNPDEVAAAVLQESAPAADQKDAQNIIRHQQQQIVVRAYPGISVLLDAPQHSSLHCPASKVAAGLLLPQMAVVLQPQAALQLVLTHSTSAGASTAAGKLLEGLSKCSARALYQVLQQQLLHRQDSATSMASAVAESGCTQRKNASVPTRIQQQQQQHRHRLQMLTKLQRFLSSGECCTEALRRHAFLQVVQTQAAAVEATDLGDNEGPFAAMSEQQQQPRSLYQLQQDLTLSVQLLELTGGCSSLTLNPKDLRAELTILTDTLDMCCYWMQQIQAAAAAAVTREGEDMATAADASNEPAQQQQLEEEEECLGISKLDELEAQYLVCEQLLGSIIRILSRAAAATAGGVSDPDNGAKVAIGAAADNNTRTNDIKLHRKLWGSTAASLIYHLDFLVSAAAPSSNPDSATAARVGTSARSQPPGSQCGQQLLLPALQVSDTLGVYVQVLCAANSSNRMALHELLLTWHKDLLTWRDVHADVAHAEAASSSSDAESDTVAHPDLVEATAAAAAATAAAKMQGKVAAFLLLLQHLAGFYQLEQQRFKQRLLTTLQEPAGAAAADADAGSSQPAASEHPLQQLQRRDRNASSGSISRKCHNTATADGDSVGAVPTSQAQQHSGIGAEATFDYMMAEESQERVESSTEEFMVGLMAETAPACYLPLLLQLLQSAESPEHVKVLALQALQPLLLCSTRLSSQHSIVIAALLADTSTPAAVQLQAVVVAGDLISAAPAYNQQLIQKLEQLLLNELNHSTSSAAPAGMQAAGMQTATTQATTQAAMQATELQTAMQAVGMQAVATQSSSVSSKSDVWSAAAGVYAVLLLREKLLLAATSWSVIAAGLLASQELQAVSLTMQQLLQCLITQKRLPRTKAALGLLMNCPESSSNISTTPASSIDVTISSNDPTNSHSAAHCSPTTTRAEQIVQRHLLGFLSPKDLNSDELQLPLLAALAQAAVAGGWGPEGAAEPTAVLLVACSPTVRGLETLLNVVQAHKSTISQPSSASTLGHLQTYTNKYKTAAAAAGRARKATAARRNEDTDNDADQEAAAAANDAAVGTTTASRAAAQAKLQDLLGEAAAAAATLPCGRKEAAGKRKATAVVAAARQQQKIKVASAAAAGCVAAVGSISPSFGPTATAAAAAGFDLDEGTKHEQMLVQRLLADRQLALQQYRAKQHGGR